MDPLRVLAAASEGGEEEGGGNFLVPNGTILFELLAFLVILFILGRYVVPPITRAMRQRQEMVERGVEDAQQARERAEAAQRAHRAELDEARAEGAKIRDKARAEADRLASGKREQAQQEVAERQSRGEEELRVQREQAERALREQVGTLAMTLSTRILGANPADDGRTQAVIDRFLQDVGSPQPDQPRAPAPTGPVVS